VGLVLLNAQSSPDPADILEQARDKLIPKLPPVGYTCVATIDRSYFVRQHPPVTSRSCERISQDRKNGRLKLQLDMTDRLRLQVIVTRGAEIYSWTHPAGFSRHVDEVLESGHIGTGVLGAHLDAVFSNPLVKFRFLDQNDGLLQFSFRVPVEASTYMIKAGFQWRETGYDGSLAIDADSLGLKRITIQSEELPVKTSMCESSTTMDYAPRSERVLVPNTARTHDVNRDSTETEWNTTFSDCDKPPEQVPGEPPPMLLPSDWAVPAKVALTTAIDTSTAAAGDVIQARLLEPMVTPSSKVLAPRGATLNGRIMRLEHHLETQGVIVHGAKGLRGRFFLIWLVFDTIEVNGAVSSIQAGLTGCQTVENGDRRCLLATLPYQKGERVFVFPTNATNIVIPAGYKSTWLCGNVGSE
jgi:hypothetical protein